MHERLTGAMGNAKEVCRGGRARPKVAKTKMAAVNDGSGVQARGRIVKKVTRQSRRWEVLGPRSCDDGDRARKGNTSLEEEGRGDGA